MSSAITAAHIGDCRYRRAYAPRRCRRRRQRKRLARCTNPYAVQRSNSTLLPPTACSQHATITGVCTPAVMNPSLGAKLARSGRIMAWLIVGGKREARWRREEGGNGRLLSPASTPRTVRNIIIRIFSKYKVELIASRAWWCASYQLSHYQNTHNVVRAVFAAPAYAPPQDGLTTPCHHVLLVPMS